MSTLDKPDRYVLTLPTGNSRVVHLRGKFNPPSQIDVHRPLHTGFLRAHGSVNAKPTYM